MRRLLISTILLFLFANLLIAGRYYDAATGRFLQIDPHASKYPSLSPYSYVANNPLKYIDPDGKDIAFAVDPQGAGGNGHTTLYFQDKNGTWNSYDQGARGETSSGGSAGFLSGQSADAGVSIQQVSGPPKGSLLLKTTSDQDGKIAVSANKSQKDHNSGKTKYNLYTNNCTDAAVDVVNNSGSGVEVENSATTVKPNSWIKELKAVEVEVNVNNNSNAQNAQSDNTKVVIKKKKYEEVK